MYQLQIPTVNPLGLNIFGSALACICWIIFFIIWLYLLFWIYKDAKRRGSSGALWAVLFFFFSWIALIIWLIVRGPIQRRSNVQHVVHHNVPPVGGGGGQYCPGCGQPMRWIQQHNRWYCDYCRQYK